MTTIKDVFEDGIFPITARPETYLPIRQGGQCRIDSPKGLACLFPGLGKEFKKRNKR